MTIKYKITFYNEWHCGSGLSAGADVDLLVIKDADGLPFVPGKTVKGLVREALTDICSFKAEDPSVIESLLGKPDNKKQSDVDDKFEGKQGLLFFKNACLDKITADAIKSTNTADFLYRNISSTEIGEDGVAEKHSLRKMEVTVPCVLTGEIMFVPEENKEAISNALKYIKRLGQNRNRGLGRCDIDVTEVYEDTPVADKVSQKGNTLYFECKLLTDVILSQSSATDGHQTTLDFIPGSNFLGIVADKLYKDASISDQAKLMLFHTGDVQFGDAHVEANGIRTLRVPASMYYPKLKKVEEECFIHHAYEEPDTDDRPQLKQCRTGFYAFSDDKKIFKKDVSTSYAIKSAHDYEKRRSMDEQMYGYESIREGLAFLFEVRFSNESIDLSQKVTEALVGVHRVGRSKTAQFGLVEIRQLADNKSFPNYNSDKPVVVKEVGKATSVQIVYADSRLIFLDPNTNQPIFRPSIDDLGFAEGEILWDKCQVRTFQYAPWNGKRQTFDSDRCGVEMGSVFVVRDAKRKDGTSDVVGSYTNEGFGKVIYNPSFLEFDENAKSVWQFQKESDDNKKDRPAVRMFDYLKTVKGARPNLLTFIGKKQDEHEELTKILESVNAFVKKYRKLFMDSAFASQWGTIRAIVVKQKTNKEVEKAVRDYISHGTAEEKWVRSGGKKVLIELMANHKKDGENHLNLRNLLISLASEMQKAIKK